MLLSMSGEMRAVVRWRKEEKRERVDIVSKAALVFIAGRL